MNYETATNFIIVEWRAVFGPVSAEQGLSLLV